MPRIAIFLLCLASVVQGDAVNCNTTAKNHPYHQHFCHVNIAVWGLGRKMFTKLRLQSRSKKFWNCLLIKQHTIIVRSRLINTHIRFIIISQLFLSIENALHGNLALTLSTKNFGVCPISLLSDLRNVDYAIQIAVLTTKCEYLQHKYTNYRSKYEIWCSETKRKHNSNFKVLLQSPESRRNFGCFHHPY